MKVISSIIKEVILRMRYRNRLLLNGHIKIGANSKIRPQNGTIKIDKGVELASNVHLVTIGGNIRIGKQVYFNRNDIVISRSAIEIGNYCSIGPNVMVYDHDHTFDSTKADQNNFKTESVVIEDKCWIGSGVIILKGSHIGEGCVIGAGAIIKGTIPAHSIVTVHQDLHINKIVDK
jgi:acetyltransferase-like isoleucine patch superfamily enzyme